jgi:hypothetical protein
MKKLYHLGSTKKRNNPHPAVKITDSGKAQISINYFDDDLVDYDEDFIDMEYCPFCGRRIEVERGTKYVN